MRVYFFGVRFTSKNLEGFRSISLHYCDVRFCLKEILYFYSIFVVRIVTYSFRNIVYVFIFCVYDDVRDIVETLVWKQSTEGCRLYQIFISFYWKSRSNEKSLSEKSQREHGLDSGYYVAEAERDVLEKSFHHPP